MKKIIHIDMDCFYAAVEIRDNPQLNNKPVAVGGNPNTRGVLCTCNYVARKYGVKSAMATAYAIKLCPELIVLPVNMAKYKQISRQIQQIFREYTDLVEPLALDEAYLDVSNSNKHNGSATLIAEEIRQKIFTMHGLTASAGVSCNKFLAKIASGWNKPNGIFVIPPENITQFVDKLEVYNLFGVGKVTLAKLVKLNISTCKDLQKLSLNELTTHFGKLGITLYNQSRGIDDRIVNPNRIRKSQSVETTFSHNIDNEELAQQKIKELFDKLLLRLEGNALPIKSQFIKIKFADFSVTTAEITTNKIELQQFQDLLRNKFLNIKKSIRLLGVGVSFRYENCEIQNSLF